MMRSVSVVLALVAGTTADERFAQLEAQLAAVHSRLTALEAENQALKGQLEHVHATRAVSPLGHTSVDSGRQLSHDTSDTTTCCRWTPTGSCTSVSRQCTEVHEYLEDKTATHVFANAEHANCLGSDQTVWAASFNGHLGNVTLSTNGNVVTAVRTPLLVTHNQNCGTVDPTLTLQMDTTVAGTLTVGSTNIGSAVATAQTDISSNTASISTNTANIATSTASISTNTANIATNTASISTNTANIATNTASIATLTSALHPATCVRMLTCDGGCDGYVHVYKSASIGVWDTVSEQSSKYDTGSTVLDTCYPAGFRGIQVKGPHTDSWIGSIEFSVDGGSTWMYPWCITGCIGAAAIPMDPDDDSDDDTSATDNTDGQRVIVDLSDTASSSAGGGTYCLRGAVCTFVLI